MYKKDNFTSFFYNLFMKNKFTQQKEKLCILTMANCGDMKNIIPIPAEVMRVARKPSDTCWVTA